jgi:hypothetical protein
MWSRLPFGDKLRAELGSPGRSRRLSSSPRSRVWRVDLAGRPAVVKQIVGGPDAEERYARELAALRLAARGEEPVVPALLGVDTGERVPGSRSGTGSGAPRPPGNASSTGSVSSAG